MGVGVFSITRSFTVAAALLLTSAADSAEKPLKRWNNNKLALDMLVPSQKKLSRNSLRKFQRDLSHIPTAELKALQKNDYKFAVARGGWIIPSSITILPGISMSYTIQTPSQGLLDLGTVRVTPSKPYPEQVDRWEQRIFNVSGYFYRIQGTNSDKDRVSYLREGNLGKKLRNILITDHESGHAAMRTFERLLPKAYRVWMKKMVKAYEAMRQKYNQAWTEAKKNNTIPNAEELALICISDYAMRNVNEYIAENFGAYVTSRETREKLKETDPQAHALIRELKKKLRQIAAYPK